MQRLMLGLILLVLLWAIGLAAFITGLPEPSQDAPIRTDGVVVYTGGGGARIAAGMLLFADGAGDRLLISGVHPNTSRARLSELWPGEPDRFDCCVDLGRQALSTEGNADEVLEWARDHQYKNIILVTSDYHMPRAVAATKSKMPDVAIYPYVVASGLLDDKGRPVSGDAWKKLSGEYTKFALARVKAFFTSFGR